MKRTIKQFTEPLTTEHQNEFFSLLKAYNQQVDAFLVQYAHLKFLHLIGNKQGQTSIRDGLVKQKFISPFGLQARQWKMALIDALETIVKQWESVISFVKTDYVYRHENLTEEEFHYANWLLLKTKQGRDWERILCILHNQDITYSTITLHEKGRKKIRHYLKRCFGKVLGKRPRVKQVRRISCDAQLYDIKTNENGVQTLEISTLKPRKRLFIGLKGRILGKSNARIIYDSLKNRLEVHQTRNVKKQKLGKTKSAADYGMSEVLTDEQTNQYGTDLWRRLQKQNEFLLEKGRRRNKLFQIAIKTSDLNKKKRIFQTNLLKQNRDLQIRKQQESVKQEINHAYRKYFTSRQIGTVGFEDISGMSGKTKYKGLSRMVSLWTRGTLRDRLEFLTEMFKIKVKYVNPAYTSQMCPTCFYVHEKNRNGDHFCCKYCNHNGHADGVAAGNIFDRMKDKEIPLYTPRKKIKEILQKRHEKKKIQIEKQTKKKKTKTKKQPI